MIYITLARRALLDVDEEGNGLIDKASGGQPKLRIERADCVEVAVGHIELGYPEYCVRNRAGAGEKGRWLRPLCPDMERDGITREIGSRPICVLDIECDWKTIGILLDVEATPGSTYARHHST